MNEMIEVSIIIPVYNEAENIEPLLTDILTYLHNDYEIIFVDDGSNDNTLLKIAEIINNNKRIKCISLSRNFGHQNALVAGLENACGQFIITMDGDGQHPPELIPKILNKLYDGNDIVNTRRNKTEDINFLKKIFSAAFYIFINIISETKIEPNNSDFKGFTKKVLESLLEFKERDLFLRGIFSWIGYKSIVVDFDAPKRLYGNTKYSSHKMISLALKATTSFSFKPLRIALLIGVFVSMFAFIFGIFAFIQYYKGNTVPGWASIIIATMFLGGVQLLAIGLLGEYIASLFTESKKRPRYIIDKKINF